MSDDSPADNLTKITWQNGLVVLPFAHLLMASAYLYAYCFGFGANVSNFVSASDIFTTSIRNLAPIYAIAAGIALLSSWERISHWMTSVARVDEQYGPHRRIRTDDRLTLGFKFIAVLFTALWAVNCYVTGKPIDVFFIAFGGLAFVLVQDVLFNARQVREVTVVMFAIAVVVGTVAFGLNSGQRDRHAEYAAQSSSNSVCDDYVVLRRFSDAYLAIGKDDRHRLIDDECKVKFTVPMVRPFYPSRDSVPVWMRWLY